MADNDAAWRAGATSADTALRQQDMHEGLTAEAAASNGAEVRSALRGLLSDLVGAAQSAVEAALDDHKRVAADHIAAFADSFRRLGRSVDQTESRVIANYAEQTAEQVESFTAGMRARSWGEIAADTEQFARRQPTLFIIGALTGGLVLGRILSAAAERHRRRTRPTGMSSAATGAEIEVARVEEVF